MGVGVKSLSIGLVEPCGLLGLGLYSAVVTFCKLGKRSCETAAGAALRSGRELLRVFAGSPPATPPPPPTAVRAGMWLARWETRANQEPLAADAGWPA